MIRSHSSINLKTKAKLRPNPHPNPIGRALACIAEILANATLGKGGLRSTVQTPTPNLKPNLNPALALTLTVS